MDCEKQRISCFKNCYITYTSRTIIFLLMPYGLTDNRQSSCCGKKCKIPKVTLSMDLFSFSYFGSNEIWHQFFMLNILYWTFWKVIDKTFMMEILPVNPPHKLWIQTPKNILLKMDFLPFFLNNKTMILMNFFLNNNWFFNSYKFVFIIFTEMLYIIFFILSSMSLKY